jgi:hypothetical protein
MRAYDVAMAAESPPREQLIAYARRLIDEAEVPLRAMGGVGVALRAPDADPALHRTYGDIDLAAPRRARRAVEDAMTAAGLQPEREFNALNGGRRQIWWTADGSLHVDVFLGEFAMCHRLDLDPGLVTPGPALRGAELLLTKLQVVERNLKDAQDAAALLTTHALAEDDGERRISLRRLREVLADDWGFYTTATDNLARIPEIIGAHAPAVAPGLAERCRALAADLEAAPKGRAFRLRAKVGRRRRWYDVPEETL